MNRLPSIPSHPAPLHSYKRDSLAPAQPDIQPASQHYRPREFKASQSHAQQLPSLRTLLEPELLDIKVAEIPLRSGANLLPGGSAARYGSASPTLKRRHDFDGYSHENNAIITRVAPVHRHAPYSASMESPLATKCTPNSTPGSRQSDSSYYQGHGHTMHTEPYGGTFNRPSAISGMSASSDPLGAISSQISHDDPMDVAKSARRRTEGMSRAPVRSSRCVGQREVPGEGLCYVYEDGTFCRAIIDGEAVNPSWGITKAGKPRKRLAQACLTCREKKIKCEPGYPKCHQCAKSQRVCRG
jgi:hypothetical protein